MTNVENSAQIRSLWQREFSKAFRKSEELLQFLEIPLDQVSLSTRRQFSSLVPRHFAEKMKKGDSQDPLLLQVLPQAAEQLTTEGFLLDAVGDENAYRSPSILQKYHGRVLVITTGACAIHCRYCFRQHFPYENSSKQIDALCLELQALAEDPSIHEVILSGGDPLALPNSHLGKILATLNQNPHLQTLRLHTRLPVVLPQRIDDDFLALFQNTHLQKVFVVHCNHPNELDSQTEIAFQNLKSAGFTLLNQTVLLKGINDQLQSLVNLSHKLFQQGVLPYYLHQLDRVAGAGHFEVPPEQALKLSIALRKQLPGYLTPLLVKENAGESNKTPLFPC